jgi:hypothetical protein
VLDEPFSACSTWRSISCGLLLPQNSALTFHIGLEGVMKEVTPHFPKPESDENDAESFFTRVMEGLKYLAAGSTSRMVKC